MIRLGDLSINKFLGLRALIQSGVNGLITLLSGGVGIKVNDDVGHHFQTQKGLKQKDPLSHVLLNIVADVLANMIPRAKEDDQVEGVISHLIDGGVSILQYAMILLFLWSMIFKKILI
jgi:hypothetical protein